jgi:hypothetical protein
LTMLVKGRGPITAAERAEIRARVEFFDYWSDWHGLLDAPPAPSIGELTPYKAGVYLRLLANNVEKVMRERTAAAAAAAAPVKLPGLPKPQATVRAWAIYNGLSEQQKRAITAQDFADRIPCAVGMVTGLPAWQELMSITGRGRKNGRHRKPGTVSLTPQMERTVGAEDPELNELIGEGREDHEPSPLEDDPPDKPPRRVYANPRRRKSK